MSKTLPDYPKTYNKTFFGYMVYKKGIGNLMIQGKIDGKRERGRTHNRFSDQTANFNHFHGSKIIKRAEQKIERTPLPHFLCRKTIDDLEIELRLR